MSLQNTENSRCLRDKQEEKDHVLDLRAQEKEMMRNQRDSQPRRVNQKVFRWGPVFASQLMELSQYWKVSGGPVRKLVFFSILFFSFLWLFMKLRYLLPERTCGLLSRSLPNPGIWIHIHVHTCTHLRVHKPTCPHTYTCTPPPTHRHTPTPTNAHVCAYTQYLFVSNNLVSVYCCVRTALRNSALSVSLTRLTHSDCVWKHCKRRLSMWRSSDPLCFYNPGTIAIARDSSWRFSQLLSAQF